MVEGSAHQNVLDKRPVKIFSKHSRAIATAPDNPVYQYHLGLAKAKAGKVAQAREAFRRALALKSDFNGAAEARKALAELEQGTSQ